MQCPVSQGETRDDYSPELILDENFKEIVGQGPWLTEVIEKVRAVGPTDATVLLLGETGTGKELIARAIYNTGPRSSGPFVKVNCASIPGGLMESELFGYEKGAFTGACSRKLGRLEMANDGTLFLDEIGDMPLDLQAKLLRVLQEREFERLGGIRTIPTNVRIVAATNKDLKRLVCDHEFRADLYYRPRCISDIDPTA
jgi:formate hydrogenlyase transcriptional activator